MKVSTQSNASICRLKVVFSTLLVVMGIVIVFVLCRRVIRKVLVTEVGIVKGHIVNVSM